MVAIRNLSKHGCPRPSFPYIMHVVFLGLDVVWARVAEQCVAKFGASTRSLVSCCADIACLISHKIQFGVFIHCVALTQCHAAQVWRGSRIAFVLTAKEL